MVILAMLGDVQNKKQTLKPWDIDLLICDLEKLISKHNGIPEGKVELVDSAAKAKVAWSKLLKLKADHKLLYFFGHSRKLPDIQDLCSSKLKGLKGLVLSSSLHDPACDEYLAETEIEADTRQVEFISET